MIRKTAAAFFVTVFPFFLLMAAVLLVFQPWFLQFEYAKPDFPEDPFGYSIQERMTYGTTWLRYITHHQPDASLSGLTSETGQPLYTDRELSHMKDAKTVYQSARNIWLLLVLLGIAFFFVLDKRKRKASFGTIFYKGSLITLIGTGAILAGVIFAFQPLFSGFHALFFAEGTWLFYPTDSLIRLFPEKLWIDGFSAVGIITVMLSGIFLLIGRNFRSAEKHPRNRFDELEQQHQHDRT